jgi:oxygen-dependent protoporphyrinogen oxidase
MAGFVQERQGQRKRRVVIIGGGITGLAAAYHIHRRSATENLQLDLLLLEASARFGGVIQTERRDCFLLETGPDSFISEKPEALTLVSELGLTTRLIETNQWHRSSFIVHAGKLHAVPEGFQLLAPTRLWPFITSDIFSLVGKARIALDLILPRHQANNGDESLAQFVRRRFGREALERIAQPMIGGIYTADLEHLSLRATMPRFLEMERAHRSVILAMRKARRKAAANDRKEATRGVSGARYGLFLSFDEGMQTLIDALQAALPEDTLRPNARVEALTFNEQLWNIRLNGNETVYADAVCLALPAYAAADLLRGTNASLANELNAIPYASTATVNLAYKRADIPHALDGFGFVVPFIEGRATLACTFSSVKFARRAPAECVLLRAFVGGALQPEMFALDEEEMIAYVRRDLHDLLGITSAPRFAQVTKWPRSMAQYHTGHIERVKNIRRQLSAYPQLALAGNAYEGVGLSDTIRSGRNAAESLLVALRD